MILLAVAHPGRSGARVRDADRAREPQAQGLGGSAHRRRGGHAARRELRRVRGAGCRAFAEKLVAGEMQPAGCNVAERRREGRDRRAIWAWTRDRPTKVVARMLCAGGIHVAASRRSTAASRRAPPRPRSRAAARDARGAASASPTACASCTFDAMSMNADGIPVIDIDKCTACGDCVEACPKDLLALHAVGSAAAGAVPQPHRRRRRAGRTAAWRARRAASA